MYSITAALLAFFISVSTTFAQISGQGDVVPVTPNAPVTSRVTFGSPFGNATITDVLNRIIDYAILVVSPLAAVMILYGAFQIMASRGDSKKVVAGRQTILYALGGLTIVILARGLVGIFRGLITGLNP
ncbi:MAG: hypothetical protein UX49_C0050G0005 [Candidatus Wolfebacteria bacterium GW2011_GWC2_46_275]|nr:MAG: divTM protein [Candidatus Wolfebacteria bacterium GW2011_GWB1_47_1]KKU34288.1 MAG: hypothetical protein UX49_C0050G0005 [Candidatus Wolfebacteria bacterium GW2011_GWC2_46_275]KKU42032.1 MAG: hypothetical protein UX58_C0004G0091 [Candidatus Wolfebacteria bacterium GW2011_GWB2_46_69]KKU54431.1 MAG: hypothetical protein UX76_C0002G0024 [Candidatus Wolfebacteria bacterium GW2011_GWC1_47_103]KKU59759.1 MAG: hypothetical protein UX83_C0002G0046 [Candidatus Wolfebacteria bacterium GW2011_GWE2_